MLTPQALLSEYIERFALPLGLAAMDDAKASVTPPRWEFLQPVMDLVTAQPAKYADALDTLQHPPLGLTPEQAQLTLAAAIRTGALQGLDGFLHPLDPEGFVVDAVSFVASPSLTDERHRPLVSTLASGWDVPVDAWPLACSQVEQRLRGWVKRWLPRLPVMRDVLDDWSDVLQVLPWAWSECEHQLAVLARLGESGPETFDALLTVIEEESAGQLPVLEPMWEACMWWRAHRARVILLAGLPPEGEWHRAAAAVCESLQQGASCFPTLAEIDEQMTHVWQGYREAYRRWHDELFGAEVVSALRQVFETAEFRAIKALSRLPLPLPEQAARCLEALAQAKARYCHGAFAQFDTEGVCLQCRLPYGSTSPMPRADIVHGCALEGVAVYARLLQDDPWAQSVRRRAARAPEEIAARVNAVFAWRPDDGAAALLALLDERILGWLSREGPPAGKRHLRLLQDGLAGHDLTLAEARASLLAWLDPEGDLARRVCSSSSKGVVQWLSSIVREMVIRWKR